MKAVDHSFNRRSKPTRNVRRTREELGNSRTSRLASYLQAFRVFFQYPHVIYAMNFASFEL